jgi:hypothetical protein
VAERCDAAVSDNTRDFPRMKTPAPVFVLRVRPVVPAPHSTPFLTKPAQSKKILGHPPPSTNTANNTGIKHHQ